jgi:pantothenate kinase
MSVKRIIDEWDPIDLLSHAPDDEYNVEVIEIEEMLKVTKDLDFIADEIYFVFDKSFRGVFSKTRGECKEIAKLILMDIG